MVRKFPLFSSKMLGNSSSHNWRVLLSVVATIIAIVIVFSSCRSQKLTTLQTLDLTRSSGYFIDDVIYDTVEYINCHADLSLLDEQQSACMVPLASREPAKTIRTTHRKLNISLADTAKASASQEAIKETHISHADRPQDSSVLKIIAFIVCIYLMALALAFLLRHNH